MRPKAFGFTGVRGRRFKTCSKTLNKPLKRCSFPECMPTAVLPPSNNEDLPRTMLFDVSYQGTTVHATPAVMNTAKSQNSTSKKHSRKSTLVNELEREMSDNFGPRLQDIKQNTTENTSACA
jgi:hypothetical protein